MQLHSWKIGFYYVVPALLIFYIFILPFWGGFITGSDWTFPYTNDQLRHYGGSVWSLWSYLELPTGTQIAHQNIYLFQIFILLLSWTGIDGEQFQKILIFLVLYSVYFSFYQVFCNFFVARWKVMLGALVYVFSPVVFNYFIMGWWFVLLFMALAPWFLYWSWKYWQTGFFRYIYGCGLFFVIAFWQSQALVWVPLLFLITWIVSLQNIAFKLLLFRGIFAFMIMGVFLLVGHGGWMYAVGSAREDYVVSTTSKNDLLRFGSVSQLFNQIRGWGSLFNLHYEFSYHKALMPLSFVSTVLLWFGILIDRNSSRRQLVLIAGLLFIVSPAFYLGRGYLAGLPLSNIIRDVSRFIIFTQLALSLGVVVFLSSVKVRFIQFAASFLVLCSMYPFVLGRLHTPERLSYGNSQFDRDQRTRTLDLPQSEIELIMKNESAHRGILLPTGGFLSTIDTHTQFHGTFTELADHDSLFSPYASGIYVSDKSNTHIQNFAKQFFGLAESSPDLFFDRLRYFGIDRVYLREGLLSSYGQNIFQGAFGNSCELLPLATSPWSITRICRIDDPFPVVYTSHLSSLDAPYQIERVCTHQEDSMCMDTVDYDHSDVTRYTVRMEPSGEDTLLVLNMTWHPGWELRDSEGTRLNWTHVQVNGLVNGWIRPPGEMQTVVALFYPDYIYKQITHITLVLLLAAFCFWLYLIYRARSQV